jgi:hypothetical protein
MAAQASCGGCDDDGVFPCPEGIGPRRARGKTFGRIKDAVLFKLGAPRVKIELDEQQLDFAVDFALKIFEDYAPRDYFDYYVFNTTPGKSVYEMPPDIGVVRNVFYKKFAQNAFSATELGGVIPMEYFYPGGADSSASGGLINPMQPVWGRMGEWVLYKQYEQMYSRISSQLGGWEWVSDHRHIKLYPTPCGCQRVVVHYLQRCKDWNQVEQAMIEGAVIQAKEMLGRIRSKYAGTYGPANSGMTLDGANLIQEAREDMEKWEERLISRFGEPLYISMD